jgi:hypothetical protein
MVSGQVSPTRIVDQWTSQTEDGTQVTYRIASTSILGFVYSAAWADREASVNAPQGPLTRARIEALFAESVQETSVQME